MPKYVIAVLLICGLGHAAAAQGFYDIDSVRTIEIVFAEANWDQILDSLFAEGNEERLLGTAYIDGLEFDSVGVRYKGYSTYSLNRVKSPFNIKLDYIIGDQELEGYGTLKLANVWYDPSFLREVLGYEIARKYMPASLANYANVYVNGTLLGLYVSVQDVDKYFMRTHFHADEGARFKGETDGSPEVLVVWGYEGEDSASYHDTFELESDAGWADLIHFLDTLNNFTAAVEKVLDVDRHLWMLAYDNLLVNLDAPINFAHNYYLFRDDSYRFNPIIWDLNMNFGGFSSIIGGQNLNITQMQQLTPYFNETNPNYPIINRILANATYKKKYVAHMKTIIAENFANGWYSARGLELQDIIDQHVQTDPNKFSTYSAFLTNLESQAGLAPGIVQLMAARIDYLNGLAAFQAQAPAISEVNHDPSEVVAYSTLWITASVSSATSVSLAYRDNEIEPFESIAMFDDGGHEDGSAGDGIYGVSLQTNATDIHYYIYAENANAATFEPTRAEFEDSVISVTSSATTPIVINEFLADNETTQQDQDGEYDDWIELHNPTASEVSLNGLHLSDKTDNVGKWTFPDTSIAAGGYLIVWADEDEEQVGLHANFKLSASGEDVVLAEADLTVIDAINFGAQEVDVSMGRCPDGSGSFATMTPTFAAANSCTPLICGDANGDLVANITDAIYLIQYIFNDGPAPNPLEAGDANCDESANITDAVYLIQYIFADGPVPCEACP